MKRRKTCRDEVGVNKVQDALLVCQDLASERGLARPIGTCDDDAAWFHYPVTSHDQSTLSIYVLAVPHLTDLHDTDAIVDHVDDAIGPHTDPP